MPFEMETRGAFFIGANGEATRIGEIVDVTETLGGTEPEDEHFKINLFDFNGFEMTLKMTRKSRRTLQRLAYGWTASGPIRKKTLHRLWEKYGIPIEVR